MKFPARDIRKARIEIIPMIDTIFFLLVFFMITSLSMVRMKAMSVALPKNTPSPVSAGGGGGSSHLVVLTVSDAGGYYVGTRRVSPETLGAALSARAATDPQAVVVLNLAKSRTAQTLISVMDAVNQVRTPAGQPVTALMATEPVDATGHALSAPPISAPAASTQVSP